MKSMESLNDFENKLEDLFDNALDSLTPAEFDNFLNYVLKRVADYEEWQWVILLRSMMLSENIKAMRI